MLFKVLLEYIEKSDKSFCKTNETHVCKHMYTQYSWKVYFPKLLGVHFDGLYHLSLNHPRMKRP